MVLLKNRIRRGVNPLKSEKPDDRIDDTVKKVEAMTPRQLVARVDGVLNEKRNARNRPTPLTRRGGRE